MSLRYNKSNIPRARDLQKNMTDEERKLWLYCLKDLPVKFRKQKPIGNYIVDFYCSEIGVVIEIDGSQHFEQDGMSYDKKRDEYLSGLGLRVVRIPNNNILFDFVAVRELIYNVVRNTNRNNDIIRQHAAPQDRPIADFSI